MIRHAHVAKLLYGLEKLSFFPSASGSGSMDQLDMCMEQPLAIVPDQDFDTPGSLCFIDLESEVCVQYCVSPPEYKVMCCLLGALEAST